jgi:adenylosuccinate synthase
MLGPGSEIDPEVLWSEIEQVEHAFGPGFVTERLVVDRHATLIEPKHAAHEAGLVKSIGSTGKGVGAARSDRILRSAELYGGEGDATAVAVEILKRGGLVQVEGTQGYGLGLHTDDYPYTTSSDCRAIDFLAMAGLSPWASYVRAIDVWVVARTFPIRVAGNSGPMRGGEISWELLSALSNGHILPERTTVTQKVRRVSWFDQEQVRQALAANGGADRCHLALTMLDYVHPSLANVTDEDKVLEVATEYLAVVEKSVGARVEMVTTGPHHAVYTGNGHQQVVDVRGAER